MICLGPRGTIPGHGQQFVIYVGPGFSWKDHDLSGVQVYLSYLLGFLFGCPVLYKVGRLKPDSAAEQVRVIVDGPGEIGEISLDNTRAAVLTEEDMEVDPGGTVGISPSGRGVLIEIPEEDGGRFVAVASFMNRLNNHNQSMSISVCYFDPA